MSIFGKVKHKAEQVVGGIKEKTGEALGNQQLADRGKGRRGLGKAKEAGDALKTKVRRAGRSRRPR